MPAQLKHAYPLSDYAYSPNELTESERKEFAALKDFFLRKKTVSDISAAIPDSARQKALLDLQHELSLNAPNTPLATDDKKRFEQSLSQISSSTKVAKAVLDDLYGYRVIQPLMDDEGLEEIMVNGLEPILVYHRQLGFCKTNLFFQNDLELSKFTAQLTPIGGKQLEDIKMADGSRCNIVFPPSSLQTTVTIRKFKKQPFSILDLIKNQTITLDLAAFLWAAMDGMLLYPMNILVVGGTASGKTTTLNALSTFIPPNERIITIEDSLELSFLNRQNWVRLEAKKSSLEELVKNSLRMRPDRLVVGEVRGSEAEMLFTAMNVGHRGVLGTLHANSDRDAITRLENAPMNVPRALIPLVDIILVQHRILDRRKGLVKRVTQVSEVSRIEDKIALNEIYSFDITADSLNRTALPSQTREKLAKAITIPQSEVDAEIGKRRELLSYMLEKGITSPQHVNLFMEKYYAEVTPKPVQRDSD
ncbi:CpaF family protein [Candidatus Micrarchaeota archaeon]|nr:CpaF family protein [Candidatus Micrarchaeota archaeon]